MNFYSSAKTVSAALGLATCVATLARAHPIDLHTLEASDPACVHYVTVEGCMVADLGLAFINRMSAEYMEERNDADAVTWVERSLALSNHWEKAKFLESVRAGAATATTSAAKMKAAKAAAKMKVVAKIKLLHITLAWEAFRRNTERNIVYLMNEEVVAREVASDYRSLFGADEADALFEALSQDRFWPMVLHYSPVGMGDWARGLLGRTGERTAGFGFAHPNAGPTTEQVVNTGSWGLPELEFPKEWVNPNLVQFVTRPGNLYMIVMKEPMIVRGMQDARISISLESPSLRDSPVGFGDYFASSLDDIPAMVIPSMTVVAYKDLLSNNEIVIDNSLTVVDGHEGAMERARRAVSENEGRRVITDWSALKIAFESGMLSFHEESFADGNYENFPKIDAYITHYGIGRPSLERAHYRAVGPLSEEMLDRYRDYSNIEIHDVAEFSGRYFALTSADLSFGIGNASVVSIIEIR